MFLSALFPFLLLSPTASPQAGIPITVATANVYVDNPEPVDFLSIPSVLAADVLVLQEVTPRWQDALVASGRWAFESSRDLEDNTDMKLFSRFPILDARTVSPDSNDTGVGLRSGTNCSSVIAQSSSTRCTRRRPGVLECGVSERPICVIFRMR